MKKRLIIIGASAMGREACCYAAEALPDYHVVGFLDSRSDILNNFLGYPLILGAPEDYAVREDDSFVCAVGEPVAKMCFVNQIKGRGGKFVSIIHPTAYIGQGVQIGQGSIIAPSTILTADIVLEGHVVMNVKSSVSHDCKIGEGTTISPGATITGRCRIGEQVFIGANAVVLPGVTMVNHVTIGAGAVVVKSIDDVGIYVGVPARRLVKHDC